jgi:hypothetical protein
VKRITDPANAPRPVSKNNLFMDRSRGVPFIILLKPVHKGMQQWILLIIANQ